MTATGVEALTLDVLTTGKHGRLIKESSVHLGSCEILIVESSCAQEFRNLGILILAPSKNAESLRFSHLRNFGRGGKHHGLHIFNRCAQPEET